MKIYFQTESNKRMSKGVSIEKIVIHPKFRLVRSDITGITFAQYDIALVKVKKKIKCDMYKRSICLPNPGMKTHFGKLNFIAGWGTLDPRYYGKFNV